MGKGNYLIDSGLGKTVNGFQYCLKEKHPKANVYNFAIDGGILSSRYDGKTIDGLNFDYISKGLDKMIKTGIVPDYIIMDGGGNDIIQYTYLNPSYLTVTPEEFVKKTTDTYYEKNSTTITICDALENLFLRIKELYPKCKIIYITNPAGSRSTGLDAIIENLLTIYKYVEDLCKQYNVQFIDLWHNSYDLNIPGNIDIFSNDGGMHLSLAGYEYCYPVIEDALLNMRNDKFYVSSL